jgi:hypothetical protein
MYLLSMVIILCVLYNNVITAISYICTYYVSTSGSTLDTVVETMLSTTTCNDGASRPKKEKAKLMCLGVTTTARYVYYNICRLVNNHIKSRNLFAINHLKDHAITSQEFAQAWLNLEPSKQEVSYPPSMSASSDTYPTTGIHTMGGHVEETRGVKTPDFRQVRTTAPSHILLLTDRFCCLLTATSLSYFQVPRAGANRVLGQCFVLQ